MSETLAAADSAAPSSAPVPPATPARRHRGLWWLLGLAALLLLAGLVVQHYLDPWLRQQLEQQVSRQTHGQYRLHVADLRTNLWQRAIRLRGLRLRPAAQLADTLPSLRLDVARLHVTGIGLLALLRKGTVPVDSVVLDSARLEVLALARRPTPGPARPLHAQLPLKLQGLEIDYFGLLHTQASYLPDTPDAAQLARADLSATDLLISAAGAADTSRVAYAASWAVRLHQARGQAAGHHLSVARLAASTATKRLQVDSLRVQPVAPAAAPAGQPRVELALPRLLLTGLDAATLLHQHRFRADSLLVDRPQVAATLPSAPATGSNDAGPALPAFLRSLDVAHLALRQGNGRLQGPAPATLRNLSVTATALHFDTATAARQHILAFARAWAVRLGPSQATMAAHSLALSSLHFSTQAGTLDLRAVRIRPPTPGQGKPGAVRVDLTLPALMLTGFDAKRLAQQGLLRAKTLELRQPRLLFVPPVQPPPPVWQLLRKVASRTDLAELRVRQADVRIGSWRHSPHVRALALTGHGIRIDQAAAAEPRRILYAQAWEAASGRLSSPFDPPFYFASSERVRLNTITQVLRFEDMRLKPRYSPVGMNLRKSYQAPAVTVNVASLTLTGLDFAGFARRGDFRMARATAQRPRVLIASDGRGPINPNLSKMSPEEMRKLPVVVDVRRLDLVEGNLYTTYRSPLTPILGKMRITRFNGSFFNFSNDRRRMTPATPLTGRATTYLQDQCRLDAQVSMYVLDPRGRHRIWGTFGPGQFSIINPMTVPTRLVAFKSGTVQRIRFDMRADRQGIRGTMRTEYTGLQMSLLGYKEDEQKVKKTLFKRMLSKAANVIVIRDQNPRKRGKLVEGRTISTREPRFSVFTLWRQGIVSGLFDNVGVPQKLAQKLSESADEAPLPK